MKQINKTLIWVSNAGIISLCLGTFLIMAGLSTAQAAPPSVTPKANGKVEFAGSGFTTCEESVAEVKRALRGKVEVILHLDLKAGGAKPAIIPQGDKSPREAVMLICPGKDTRTTFTVNPNGSADPTKIEVFEVGDGKQDGWGGAERNAMRFVVPRASVLAAKGVQEAEGNKGKGKGR